MKLINVSKKVNNTEILLNINVDFIGSGLVFIKGDSGSGKTTLLNIISMIDTPTLGRIEGNDYKITTLFQDNNLLESLTVEENLSMYENTKIDELLIKLKIEHLKEKKVKNISVGEKRRVAIARTLLQESEIIVLDEPNTNLDEENIKNIFKILKELSKNKLIICTLHGCDYLNDLADQIIVLSKGNIVSNDIVRNEKNIKTSEKRTISKKFLNNISKYFFKEIDFIHIILITILLTSYFIINCIGNFNFIDIELETLEKENNNTILFNYHEDINNKIKTKYYWKDNAYMALDLVNKETENSYYMYSPINYFYYYKELNNDIIGKEPEIENEIMITELLAEKIIFHGIKDINGNILNFKEKNEIINKTVSLSGIPVKISGIYKQNLKKYEVFKNYELWSYFSHKDKLVYEELNFLNEISYISDIIFVNEKFDKYISIYDEGKEIDTAIPTFINIVNKKEQEKILKKLNNTLPKINLMSIEYRDLTRGTIYSSSISEYLKQFVKLHMILKYIIPIIILIIIFEINSIYQLLIKKNKKDIMIIKSLGISKKDLSYSINKSLIYCLIISLFFSILLSTITTIILNKIATAKVGFYFKPFSLNIKFCLILIIILLLLTLIGKLMLNKKINKLELSELRNI